MMLKRRSSKRKVLSVLLAFMLLFNFAMTTIAVDGPSWPVEYPLTGPAISGILLESGQDETSVCENPVRYESNFQTDSVSIVQIDGRDAYEVAVRKYGEGGDKWDYIGWRILDPGYEMKGVVIKSGNDYMFYDYSATTLEGDVNLVGPSKNISLLWFCVVPREVPEETGMLEVTKEIIGEYEGIPSFTIVVEDSQGSIVETFILGDGDSNGVTLPVGTYFVRETDIEGSYEIEGYYLNGLMTPETPDLEGYVEVTIENDTITQLLVKNEVISEDTGSVRITKEIISEFEGSPSFTIVIEDSQGTIVETFILEDGNFGEVTLPVGTYYVKETVIESGFELEGYYLDGSMVAEMPDVDGYVEVTVEKDMLKEVLVKNDVKEVIPGTGTLRVWKEILGVFEGEPLFTIIVEDDEGTLEATFELGDGFFGEETLSVGTYYVKETMIESGFELEGYYLDGSMVAEMPDLDGYVEVIITEGETTEVLVRNTSPEEPNDNLIISKQVIGEVNGGTMFTIEVRNSIGEVVWMTFPNNGDFGDTYLPGGTYYIEEIEIPYGYQLEGYFFWNVEGWTELPTVDGVAEVEIVEGEPIEVCVRNSVISEPGEARIIIKKVLLDTTPNPEVEFTVEVIDDSMFYESFLLNHNETDITSILEPGEYRIREIGVSGYSLYGFYLWDGEDWVKLLPDGTGYVTVMVADENVNIEVRNYTAISGDDEPIDDTGGGSDEGSDEGTTEPVVVEEPAPEVIVEETEPMETTNLVEEPIWVTEAAPAAPALPDTGGNNTMVRVLGTFALLSGAVLTMTDRKRTE